MTMNMEEQITELNRIADAKVFREHVAVEALKALAIHRLAEAIEKRNGSP